MVRSKACVVLLALASGAAAASPMEFSVTSAAVNLRPGQVQNNRQPIMSLPDDVIARYADGEKMMAIVGFSIDMIRKHADGSESQVKLNDHYLHHYILTLGRRQHVTGMFEHADHNPSEGHLMKGCHGMTRTGLSHYLDHAAMENPADRPHSAVIGSASGGEYRDNPQYFHAPYRRMLYKPDSWAPILHIIRIDFENSSGLPYSPLLECPCTPQRVINVSAGTIDGEKADKIAYKPIHCSDEFLAQSPDNPSCFLSTYRGGWRCCEHGVFVIDTDKQCASPDCLEKPVDEIFLRFTFSYEDEVPGVTRQVEAAACCDITSDHAGNENNEHDVPQCPEGTPPEKCIWEAESVQPVSHFHGNPKSSTMNRFQETDMVDLVFSAPHMHTAGLSLELIDDETGEVLCEVHRSPDNSKGIRYGTGSTPGNENGYLVGLTPCAWDDKTAHRFRRNHPLRMRSVYNASVAHMGVMSLWLMDVAPVGEPDIVV